MNRFDLEGAQISSAELREDYTDGSASIEIRLNHWGRPVNEFGHIDFTKEREWICSSISMAGVEPKAGRRFIKALKQLLGEE